MIAKLFMYVLDNVRQLFSAPLIRRLIIAGFVIILLVISGPFLANAVAGVFFARGQYARAHSVWSVASSVSLQERDMMNANAGNALYRQGRLPEAVNQYERALKIAPSTRICAIKWNLALTLIRRGEENEANNISEAISMYSRALFELSDDTCLRDSFFEKPMQDKVKDIKERIAKLNKKSKENNSDYVYRPNTDFKAPTAEEKEKDLQINRMNSKNTGQYHERQQQDDDTEDDIYNQTWW